MKRSILVCVLLSAALSQLGAVIYLQSITVSFDFPALTQEDVLTGVHTSAPMTRGERLRHGWALLFWPSVWWREFLGFFLVSLSTSVCAVLVLYRPPVTVDQPD